ncbi:MAG: hypothetical protein AABN33_01285 [Acidobacteriota bacterium]
MLVYPSLNVGAMRHSSKTRQSWSSLTRITSIRLAVAAWVDGHYDKLELPGYETIYIRKQE